GWAESDTEFQRAFRWTEAGGMVDLGTLKTDNSGDSEANALSADGSVAAGRAESDTEFQRAFRWTEAGGMVDLGTLKTDNSGDSYAYALSADGSVAAGWAESDTELQRAFRWTEADGMVDLGTLKTDNSGDSYAYALSADGSVVAGESQTDNGELHAFIYRSIMQDYDNLLASFPLLANDADVAVAVQQWTLASILDQTCFAGRKGRACLSLAGRFSYTGADDELGLGSRTGATGLLSLGYGVNEAFTLGATAALGLTDLDHNGFDMETGYGFGIWGEYSQDGASRTGWQLSAVAGWGTQDADITRGMGLDNVELVDGSSDLSTLSGRLSLGYGFRNPDDWVLTPRASVTAYRTRLDAYEETEGDFTADYDRMEVTTTTATVEVTAVKRIGNGSRLSLGAGLDYDLDADRATLEGTSNLLGLETFSAGSSLDRNDLRPFVAAAYSFRVTDSSWFTTSAGVQSPVFGNSPRIDAGLRYCVRF
ncbi:MAG: autotransporter domain-containing protein, partial [Chlorobiales bacterium]|nr:autotransporter domain-containing protein [Chlorobiales bacterium]